MKTHRAKQKPNQTKMSSPSLPLSLRTAIHSPHPIRRKDTEKQQKTYRYNTQTEKIRATMCPEDNECENCVAVIGINEWACLVSGVYAGEAETTCCKKCFINLHAKKTVKYSHMEGRDIWVVPYYTIE